jgi:hypothetical protein
MPIEQKDFTNNLFSLLREFFESPPTTGASCLDQKTGLFDTLSHLSAEQVSKRTGEAPTIVAHCEHVRFYNNLLLSDLKGETIGKVDWKQTWLMQSVNNDEWETLKNTLKSQYQEMMALLESFETWDDDKVGIPMAVLAHTAYHLGAIRQLIRFV